MLDIERCEQIRVELLNLVEAYEKKFDQRLAETRNKINNICTQAKWYADIDYRIHRNINKLIGE